MIIMFLLVINFALTFCFLIESLEISVVILFPFPVIHASISI